MTLTEMVEMALSGEEGEGLGHNCSTSKCVKKSLISRQTLGHFSTLDLTKTFEWTFRQFAHSTATCRVF